MDPNITKENEYKFLANPNNLLNLTEGIPLQEEGNPNSGKLLFSLLELSLHKRFITPRGNVLCRISPHEVMIAGHKILLSAPGGENGDSSPSSDRVTDPTNFKVRVMEPKKKWPGEKTVFTIHASFLAASGKITSGTLFSTNFQLVFIVSNKRGQRDYLHIPHGSVHKIDKISAGLWIHRKDFGRSFKLLLNDKKTSAKLKDRLLSQTAPIDQSHLFAFHFKPDWSYVEKEFKTAETLLSDGNIETDGWNLYKTRREYARFGVPGTNSGWRETAINQGWEVCDTYPEILYTPTTLNDHTLRLVAQFRSKGRLPALSWIHTNGAAIVRCSQPKVGVGGNRSVEDEHCFACIHAANENGKDIMILDSRPKINAVANQAMGSGFESSANYKNMRITFQGIQNIHTMRGSLNDVQQLSQSLHSNGSKSWLSKIDSSGWLGHIKLVLRAANKAVEHILRGSTIVIHCSDGWDRTSQVSSLAQLCLDPFYRTISGFCILIEKEWISFGHKFSTRLGHNGRESEEFRSPIFLQFLDCVHQIMYQYPSSFEFNNSLLVTVMDEAFSARFGTFLCDCDKERSELKVRSSTTSLWSYIHRKGMFYKFKNPFYRPPLPESESPRFSSLNHLFGSPTDNVLTPRIALSKLRVWHEYFLRQQDKFCDNSLRVLEKRGREMRARIRELESHLQSVLAENKILKEKMREVFTSDPPPQEELQEEEEEQETSELVNEESEYNELDESVGELGGTEDDVEDEDNDLEG